MTFSTQKQILGVDFRHANTDNLYVHFVPAIVVFRTELLQSRSIIIAITPTNIFNYFIKKT